MNTLLQRLKTFCHQVTSVRTFCSASRYSVWHRPIATAFVAIIGCYANGTALAGPIVINTVQELQNIQNNLSGDYILGSNIDASGFAFAPIGSNPFQGGTAFTGTFNGNGHTINGLTITAPSSDNVGLFGYVIGYTGGGTVENVRLTNENVVGNGSGSVGGVIGYSDTGHISNVSVSGSVKGITMGHVGGIVGSGGSYYGASSLTSSFSTATVQGEAGVGGLVGEGVFNIQNTYAAGPVSGTSDVGGLAGIGGGSVSSSYAAGAVTGTSNVGGLIGSSGAYVQNSYWDTQASGQSTSAGGKGLTTSQLQSGTLPTGFDPTVWTATAGQYPSLKSMAAPLDATTAAMLSNLAYLPTKAITSVVHHSVWNLTDDWRG